MNEAEASGHLTPPAPFETKKYVYVVVIPQNLQKENILTAIRDDCSCFHFDFLLSDCLLLTSGGIRMAVAFEDSIKSEFPSLTLLTSGAGYLLLMGAVLCIEGRLVASLDTIATFQSVSRHSQTSPEVRGGLQTTPYMHLENYGPMGNSSWGHVSFGRSRV